MVAGSFELAEQFHQLLGFSAFRHTFSLNRMPVKCTLTVEMLFTPDLRIAARPSTNGPEALFVSSFLASGMLGRNGNSPLIFHEPKLPTGFPDIVAVYLRDSELTLNPSRNSITSEHLKLLQHVCSIRTTSFNAICADLGWRNRSVRRCIEDLENANLVSVRGDRVSSRQMKAIFAAKKIIAIEAKIDNWWRAVHQASSNTWFASHSYVLIPRNRNLEVIKQEALGFGVGVIVFDGSTAEIALEARAHSLPASYGSWLFNEWAIRRVFSVPLGD
jgi:hypothetical protein